MGLRGVGFTNTTYEIVKDRIKFSPLGKPGNKPSIIDKQFFSELEAIKGKLGNVGKIKDNSERGKKIDLISGEVNDLAKKVNIENGRYVVVNDYKNLAYGIFGKKKIASDIAYVQTQISRLSYADNLVNYVVKQY